MAVKFHPAVEHLLIPLGDIKEWPNNPRRGDLAALKESIISNGFYAPVVVQRSTNYVIAGNHRRLALEELGATQIPVVYADVDDLEAAKIALGDNRTSDLAFYDDKALFDLLEDLVQNDSLVGTGYNRAAYELLLQGLESDGIVGGVRQGLTPQERMDAYNELDVRSIILPYDAASYEEVAAGLAHLRKIWQVDNNADVVRRLVLEQCDEVGFDPEGPIEPERMGDILMGEFGGVVE